MAHSIEARLPFLDYRFVEFCLGLKEEFKVSHGWTKKVLRDAMRGRLPEKVRVRQDKLGFATAEEAWMRGEHRELFLKVIEQSLGDAQSVLTREAKREIDRILDGRVPFSFLIWRLISFGQWMRRFEVRT
jgi:asparagine synthase (glutamine-hydrolysing)